MSDTIKQKFIDRTDDEMFFVAGADPEKFARDFFDLLFEFGLEYAARTATILQIRRGYERLMGYEVL